MSVAPLLVGAAGGAALLVLIASILSSLRRANDCPRCGAPALQLVDHRRGTAERDGVRVPGNSSLEVCSACGHRVEFGPDVLEGDEPLDPDAPGAAPLEPVDR